MVVFSHLEQGVAIICACLPACRSLLEYLFPKMKMNLEGSTGKIPAPSTSNIRRKRNELSARSFFELRDRMDNAADLERGNITTNTSRSSAMHMDEKLVPDDGFALEAKAHVGHEVESMRNSSDSGKSQIIVITETLQQSHQHAL